MTRSLGRGWITRGSIAVLLVLFLMQRRGSARVGGYFGPVIAMAGAVWAEGGKWRGPLSGPCQRRPGTPQPASLPVANADTAARRGLTPFCYDAPKHLRTESNRARVDE